MTAFGTHRVMRRKRIILVARIVSPTLPPNALFCGCLEMRVWFKIISSATCCVKSGKCEPQFGEKRERYCCWKPPPGFGAKISHQGRVWVKRNYSFLALQKREEGRFAEERKKIISKLSFAEALASHFDFCSTLCFWVVSVSTWGYWRETKWNTARTTSSIARGPIDTNYCY